MTAPRGLLYDFPHENVATRFRGEAPNLGILRIGIEALLLLHGDKHLQHKTVDDFLATEIATLLAKNVQCLADVCVMCSEPEWCVKFSTTGALRARYTYEIHFLWPATA